MLPTVPIIGQGWFPLSEQALAHHLVCVGASGSGKTETLLRIAYGAAKVYGWQVLFLDAKGDRQTATRFVAAMLQGGKRRIKMFPAAFYGGWRGDANALLNRLIAIEDYSDAYYKGMAKLMLSLAINVPVGLPKNSRELLARLRLDALTAAYKGLPEEAEVLQIRPRDAAGVYNRYRAFFGMIGSRLDGSFAFEDVDAAYLLLDGLALREEASSLGRYLLEDFAHYVVARKQQGRRVLLLIDDFSALSMHTEAVNLFERIRSYGGAVVISSQSYAALGRTRQDAERILGAAATLIVHRSSDPEPLVARAGMQQQVQANWQLFGRLSLPDGSVRVQETFLVPPEDVRRLLTGQAFVIGSGQAQKVSIAALGLHPQALVDAEALVKQQEQAQAAVLVPAVLPPISQKPKRGKPQQP